MRWNNKSQSDVAISEAEILALTADMVDAHYETLPRLTSALEDWNRTPEETERSGFSRRSFIGRASMLAIGGAALASTGASASVIPRLVREKATGASRGLASGASTDVQVAALAASLENLAIAVYDAGLAAATAGKLGTVPKAVATFVVTAKGQHTQHAAAWNSIITGGGYKEITAPNAVLAKPTDASLAKVSTVPELAMLALSLENAAAATYLEAIGLVSGAKAIETAATIHPVEMQHAAILNFVLGNYPVPASFATVTGGAPISAVPALTKM